MNVLKKKKYTLDSSARSLQRVVYRLERLHFAELKIFKVNCLNFKVWLTCACHLSAQKFHRQIQKRSLVINH